jgi:hypothetical protein
MNKILVAALLACTFATVAHAEDKTCGQMMAAKAVLPAKMAETMTAVANMFDAHAKFMLEGKTKEGKKEADAFKGVAKQHRDLAAGFKKTAESMNKLATLPAAPHDMAKMMADPGIGAAMQEMMRTHKEMVALLQKEIADMEAMGKK